MIIRDKQDLRRCVKQAVRRSEVVETRLDFDVQRGETGVGALMGTWAAGETPALAVQRACASGTPLERDAIDAFSALNALDLPAHDVNKAEAIAQGYDRTSYLVQVLLSMRARRVLVATPLSQAEQTAFPDDRFSPLLVVEREAFAPGRYGVDYASVAQRIAQTARSCGAKGITLASWDAQALSYCLAPLCEDECLVLHAQADTREQAAQLLQLVDAHPRLRMLASATGHAEHDLIAGAATQSRMLVRISDPQKLCEAVGLLGTRLLAYSACARLPEQMLGRWVRAREAIWQALYEAYLPLARAGYELTDEAIGRDVARMLGGAYEELHTAGSDE